MTDKQKIPRLPPKAWPRTVVKTDSKGNRKEYKYFMVSFRDPTTGKTVNRHIPGNLTQEEADAAALEIKTRELGQDMMLSSAPKTAASVLQDVMAKIKADREALIARDAQRLIDKFVLDEEAEARGEKLQNCIRIESWQPMICNACGSDFCGYPSEAKHCPACTSTDLAEMPDTHNTINARIWEPELVRSARKKTATKRIEYQRKATKRSKQQPAMTLQEGWVDSIPPSREIYNTERSKMGLGADDNFVWYCRCGNYGFAGYKTAENAQKGLIAHCKDCAGGKEACWLPAKKTKILAESLTKAKVLVDQDIPHPPGVVLLDNECWKQQEVTQNE